MTLLTLFTYNPNKVCFYWLFYLTHVQEGAVEEYKPNGTDMTVIRQLTLLNLFVLQPKGISFDEINKAIYSQDENSSLKSHKRMFHRDRETLQDALGFYTLYNNQTDLYEIDTARTCVLVGNNDLSNAERKAIRDITLPHLIESYAEQSDLIVALNKLSIPLSHARKILPSDVEGINFLKGSLGIKYVIWSCFINRKRAHIKYKTAEGNDRDYTARIYGTFSIGDNQYFVANIADDENEDIRTLRYDRVEEIKPENGSHHYEIPEDYQDQHFLKLPFQIGKESFKAKVLVEKDKAEEFASVYRKKGTISVLPNGDIEWDVSVSDEDVFLYWLITYGFIPIAPLSLKNAFIDRLERVINDEEK